MKNKKILLVDDIAFIIEFEKHILKELSQELSIDIDVHTAKTVDEALAKIENTFYDAMVIDMNLPDGSGLDIAKASQQKDKETRIAGLTIYPCDTLEYSKYLDAIYKKPISPTLYKKAIKQLLATFP